MAEKVKLTDKPVCEKVLTLLLLQNSIKNTARVCSAIATVY
jgi:hypothetical protein